VLLKEKTKENMPKNALKTEKRGICGRIHQQICARENCLHITLTLSHARAFVLSLLFSAPQQRLKNE
jgi:hypothetical protein